MPGALGKAVQSIAVVTGWNLLAHPLEPRIAEARSVGVNAREFIVVVVDHGDIMLAAQRIECIVAKAFMPWFDRVAEPYAVLLARK